MKESVWEGSCKERGNGRRVMGMLPRAEVLNQWEHQNNNNNNNNNNTYSKALASVYAVTRREPGPPAGDVGFRDW